MISLDNAIIDEAIQAIDEKIGRLQESRAEWVEAKGAPENDAPTDRSSCSGKKKDDQTKPAPNRPKEVRRFVTQTDIVTILEHAGKPLSELHIKEQLDALLNVKPSDATLVKVLGVSLWKKGAKRYRKNGDGKYELYEPEEDEAEE